MPATAVDMEVDTKPSLKKGSKKSVSKKENMQPNVQSKKTKQPQGKKVVKFNKVVDEQEVLYCLCKTSYDEARPMIACDLCCNWFHFDCLGMSQKAVTDAQNESYFFCPECNTTLNSDSTKAVQTGLSKFFNEYKFEDLEDLQSKMCDKYKSQLENSKLQDIHLNKNTLVEALVYFGISVSVAAFLTNCNVDHLKAFLKKKNLPVSGTKNQLANRVYNVWYMPSQPKPLVFEAGNDLRTFVLRARMLEMFYYEKFSQLCEEKQVNTLGHESLTSYITYRHWSGSSGSKKEKMTQIRDNLLLVDEMREFVTYIAQDLTQAIVEPNQTIQEAINDITSMKKFLSTFTTPTLRHYCKRYGVSNKGSTKKVEFVGNVIVSFQSETFCAPEGLVQPALKYAQKDASKNPVGLYNLLSWTKDLMLQAFPVYSWWAPKLAETFNQMNEIDVTDRSSELCHQLNPLVQCFVEISLGEEAQMDNLLAGFDQFCISPGKKKAQEKEKKQAENKAAKEKEKKKQKALEKKLKPKRALTPYMAFVNQYRPKAVTENPSVTFGELSKIVGAAWGKVGKKEKVQYQNTADQDKVRYESEMEEWRKTQKPKKSLSSYMAFVKSERSTIASNEDADFATISRLLGAAWKDMAEEQKAFFNSKAEQDKVRYESEMAVWRAANPDKAKPVKEIKEVKVKVEGQVKKEGEQVLQELDMPALEAV